MRAETEDGGGLVWPTESLVLRGDEAGPCPQSDRTRLSPPTATRLPTSPRRRLPSRPGPAADWTEGPAVCAVAPRPR